MKTSRRMFPCLFVKTFRGCLSIVLLSAFFFLNASSAEGSWLIDARRLHISAHGQNSCLDCHSDIQENDLHPDPLNVRKTRNDFFSPDKCLSCHDSILGDLDEGLHGSRKVKNRSKYEKCLRCHRPHRQNRLGENQIGEFDPARPRHDQCGACHEKQDFLPPPGEEETKCFECHVFTDFNANGDQKRISKFCMHCHGRGEGKAREITGKVIPLINRDSFSKTKHAGVACTICHPRSAQFRHFDQGPGDCRQCHSPHDEKVAGAAHMRVSCEACHLSGVSPVRDPESGLILWQKERDRTGTLSIHEMVATDDETLCRRCHVKGNNVGAAAMVLPAKSIICMPCHSSTFSVGDTVSLLSLIIFLSGLFLAVSYWASGSVSRVRRQATTDKVMDLIRDTGSLLFSIRVFKIIKAVVLDVLLQRRLYRQSRYRWVVHGLIFYPFMFRFIWGLAALTGSLWNPGNPAVWYILDNSSPATAFLFDLTGVMIIFGTALSILRGIIREPELLEGVPGQDRLALGLLASITLAGFIVEGMGISMAGRPEGSAYSFIGYLVSILLTKASIWESAYGYLWYVHAVLTGIFIAYIPFSRLMHIIMAPFIVAINAVHESGKKKRENRR